jgi:hypothetical protein
LAASSGAKSDGVIPIAKLISDWRALSPSPRPMGGVWFVALRRARTLSPTGVLGEWGRVNLNIHETNQIFHEKFT